MALQEVRAFPEQLDEAVRTPKGWHRVFSPAQRPGYSGVAVYSRAQPDRVENILGESRFDIEGRYLEAHFGRMVVASVYFPKGSGRDRDNSRVSYKLDFYGAVFDRVEKLRRHGPVYVTGDYNTAHEAIDLARPKTNTKSSGFLSSPMRRAIVPTRCEPPAGKAPLRRSYAVSTPPRSPLTTASASRIARRSSRSLCRSPPLYPRIAERA